VSRAALFNYQIVTHYCYPLKEEMLMRFNDALIGVGIIIFGLVVIIHVQSFPLMGGRPTPAMFPMVIGALLMLVGTVLIYSGVKSGAPLVTFL